MSAPNNTQKKLNLTHKILLGMILGITSGLILFYLPANKHIDSILIDGLLNVGGQLFITAMKMLVVPVVFVSLVCGVCHLGDAKKLGRMGGKTLLLYLLTTSIAISLGLFIAELFSIGTGSDLTATGTFSAEQVPSLKVVLLNFLPSNPFAAMVKGEMIQIIVFAILFGSAISLLGNQAKRIATFFDDINIVIMKLISMLIYIAPYGVFCLVAALFAEQGLALIGHLLSYFLTVLFVLLLHVTLTNSLLLKVFAKLNPLVFFRKMYPTMIFAFSTSSSNVSIPVTLSTVEKKLGVNNSIASFVIPLGATINMDGTAIMQGVATVFIANAYNIHLGITQFLMVVLTATMASIGTAGVPGVGLITLAMVLNQVGLPVEGISLIIGVDRLLDMVRTAVNITGDSAIACLIGKSEQAIDETIFYEANGK